MAAVAYIFARGGSKGVPRKNLRKINGLSLLQRAIETAYGSKYIDQVIVSTDDQEIAKHGEAAGAVVPFIRPAILASDTAKEWLAWQHAAQFSLRAKIAAGNSLFVSIPTTTPLKTSTHIDQCIDLYRGNDFSAVVTGYPSNHHPSFNMVKYVGDGDIKLIAPPVNNISGRQSVPYQAYNLTTVCYVTSHKYVITRDGIFDQKVGMLEVDRRTALDIDTEYDLKLAKCLLHLD